MHLVCVPTRPHMHHVAHRVMHFLPARPSIRHHPHHHRICRHAHQRCHWEEDLGGPAGSNAGSWGGMGEESPGDSGFGFAAGSTGMGGDFGGGLGSGVLGPLSFVQPFAPSAVIQLVIPPPTVSPPPDIIPPIVVPPPYTTPPMTTPPSVAIPEPSTWAMLLLGAGALMMIKKWRRA